MKPRNARKKDEAKVPATPAPLKVLPALTERQSRCLLFIFNFYAEHRHFPTHREIAEGMGSRSKTAAMYIDPLVEKGYLTRSGEDKKEARNIRLTLDGVERLRLMGANV